MTPFATYVYCIVSSRHTPSATDNPSGPPGTGEIRLLNIRPNRYAVVSDARLDQFGERPLREHLSDLDWVSRAVVAHEAVVASFAVASDGVVPMKPFTLFTSDARALEQLRFKWRQIESIVRNVTQHEEWGARLVFDDSRALSADAVSSAPSGRGYLIAKRREHARKSARSVGMRRVAGDVLKSLRTLARDTRQRSITATPDSRSRLLFDVAFLVPRTKAARFQKTAERQAQKISAAGYLLQLSGPWPPYSFADNS